MSSRRRSSTCSPASVAITPADRAVQEASRGPLAMGVPSPARRWPLRHSNCSGFSRARPPASWKTSHLRMPCAWHSGHVWGRWVITGTSLRYVTKCDHGLRPSVSADRDLEVWVAFPGTVWADIASERQVSAEEASGPSTVTRPHPSRPPRRPLSLLHHWSIQAGSSTDTGWQPVATVGSRRAVPPTEPRPRARPALKSAPPPGRTLQPPEARAAVGEWCQPQQPHRCQPDQSGGKSRIPSPASMSYFRGLPR